jgi:hypothetical protein
MVSEREAVERIYRGDLRLGPLMVVERNAPSVPAIDLVLTLKWEGRTHSFMVEYTGIATPRRIEMAIAQLQRYKKSCPEYLPMVAAPMLSEAMINRLMAEGISGVDLSGNYVVMVPGEWFVLHTGEQNKFPQSQPIKGVFEGTSSLVGRELLRCHEFERSKELQAEILRRGGAISKGTISKILASLEESLIARRKPTIKLLQPELLLDELADNYARPVPAKRIAAKVRLDNQFFEKLRKSAEESGVRVIGRDESLYVAESRTDRLITLYATDIDKIVGGMVVDHRFPNVELLELHDSEIYFDPTERNGFPWCSQLQIYLELVRGGKREQDIAAAMRESILMAGKGDD